MDQEPLHRSRFFGNQYLDIHWVDPRSQDEIFGGASRMGAGKKGANQYRQRLFHNHYFFLAGFGLGGGVL